MRRAGRKNFLKLTKSNPGHSPPAPALPEAAASALSPFADAHCRRSWAHYEWPTDRAGHHDGTHSFYLGLHLRPRLSCVSVTTLRP
jgi:hypothetical protein